MFLGRTVTDWASQAELLRAARAGMIEVVDGRMTRVRLWRFSRRRSMLEVRLLGALWHRRSSGDRCRLYWRQPRRHANFLVLDYVISQRGTSLRTFRGAVRLLDELARLKRSDALLCDVASLRISDRLLARWGWEPLAPRRWHRPSIKRFYGEYPPSDAETARLLAGAASAAPPETELALCR